MRVQRIQLLRASQKGSAARERTLVMGIINVTPDSFYDGGRFSSPERVRWYAELLMRDGADVLDVGAESSRPGAAPIGVDEELKRLMPALEALADLPLPISVDTYRAEVARRALRHRATMINDITAFRYDPEMAEVVAEAGCPCILMHMQGTPQTMQQSPKYKDVVDDICAFFEERMSAAIGRGVREDQIWLDPGFGFGKTVDHNLTLLRRLHVFKQFGRPILVGTSNKSTIGAVLNAPLYERMEGTAATVAIAIWNGADMVRVHDVRAMARVVRMTDAIIQGSLPGHE